MDDVLNRDFDLIKSSLVFEKQDFGMYVYVVAVSNDYDKNKTLSIPAGEGEPIENSCYDSVKECFYVHGMNFYSLGFVPVSYKVSLGETTWSTFVSLPYELMSLYMGDYEKENFEKWKSQFTNCKFLFFQVTDSF